MKLNKLTLLETSPNTKVIRTVNFHDGMNFVVDAGVNKEKGNGVGKTTFLKLIDICLGSSGKKYLYTDYDTDEENVKLRDYISASKVRVELLLTNSLKAESNQDPVTLGVDLFPKGHKYVNHNPMTSPDYNIYLNKLFFKNDINKPTFRELIGMFVRINVKKDTSGFLHFLDEHVSTAKYRLVYSYLFELSSPEITNRIYDEQTEIKTLEKQLKDFKTLNNIRSQDAVKQKVSLLISEIKDTKQKLDVMVDSKRFLENQEKVNEVRVSYAHLNDAIDAADYQLETNKAIFKEALHQQKSELDTDSLRELFEDAQAQLTKVTKTFNELVNFNKELLSNKVSFFENQVKTWDQKKQALESQREQLFKEHKNLIMLIQDDKIEEYTALQNKLGENQEDLGKSKQVLATLESLDAQQKQKSKVLERLLQKESDASNQLTAFNKFFTSFSKELNGEEYILYQRESGFPLDIGLKNSRGLSTGTKKALIAAFDLAYQEFSKSIHKPVPEFVVHDVLETLDSIAFNGIINLATQLQTQFVVAVLKNKVEPLDSFSPQNITLTLTETDTLFGV